MRKFIFIITTILILLFPTPIFADMGPKPSVTININGLSQEKCYITLLSKEKGHGPWRLYDGTENTKRNTEEYGSIDIWEAFVQYQDIDNYSFLQYFGECSNNKSFKWLYYPPDDFKILFYFPDSHDFIISSTHYKRYAFDSYYDITVQKDTKSVYVSFPYFIAVPSTNQSSSFHWIQPSLFVRIFITICIELLVAFLFSIRSKKQIILIIIMNIITQFLLNTLLNVLPFGQTIALLLFHYLWIECLIILIEATAYIKSFQKSSQLTSKTILLYTITANLCSFIIGFILLNIL